MLNAHQRLAKINYVQDSKNNANNVEVWSDRFAHDGNGALMVSFFGNSTEVGAVAAAISLGMTLQSVLPDGTRQALNLGEKPIAYRATLPIPDRQRPILHYLYCSQSLMHPLSTGTVYSLQSDTHLLWSTLTDKLGLPACPGWARLGVKMLRSKGLIRNLGGFGCSPVSVTATREMILEWLGDQVRMGALSIPETKGPIAWPLYTISDLLHGPKPPAAELVAEAVGF